MNGATQWPGQEVTWPGQEVPPVAQGQGEHGYAPAPPGQSKPGSSTWMQTLGGAAETITSPEAQAADQATAQAAPSLEEIRARIQEADKTAQDYLKAPAGAGPLEWGVKAAGSLGTHLAANLAQVPINILLGLTQEGPQIDPNTGRLIVPGATINPETGNYGVTPEASAAGSLAAFPLRFGGANALMRDHPPGVLPTLTKPLPVTVDELRAAIVRAGEKEPPQPQPQPTAGETAPPGQGSQAGTGEAQPAGAQITPASELGLTPREEAAYRSTAEGQKLLEPQEPGVRDDKTYLPGERINEAHASQDVEVARELQSLRQQTPALDKSMTADENHNNNIRANAINNTIPGQVQIGAAKTAREEAMKAAEPKVFENATDADVQPIVKDIQDILNDPKNRQNSQLQQYVRPLIDRLQNEDGTPKITDARELWGFRQDVQHLTSGAAQRSDPNLSRVSGMLGKVLESTDDRIEAAAPGYKAQLRDDYRTRSREIDAMEALNAERFKLFDSQNKPNFNAVQGLMRRIVDARQANDPYDAFTHVSQDTLDKLWNIRDSMRRQAAVDRLGAPRSSPTSQNLGDALRAAGRMAIQGAAPVIGGTLGQALIPIPGVGPAIGIAAGATVNHLLSERAMGQRLARGLELTNPNTLMQPPTP